MRNPDDFEGELNHLIQDFHFKKSDTPTGCPPSGLLDLWFPTPETCNFFSILTPRQREIYDQILQLQRHEKFYPKINEADKLEFLKYILWENCVINADQKRQREEFLVEYHDVLAKHRFDVGYNTELKIKKTPEHPFALYAQFPPGPILLHDESLIELGLFRNFDVIITVQRQSSDLCSWQIIW